MSDDTLFNPPRGMRDFYPADMVLRTFIFNAWHAAARAAGFEPYDASVVESLALLKRKSGEEIGDQLYTFADKSGRELALRAEMTPTLARMIIARQNELPLPLKWYTVAQCFRYERMSKGRKREHYQWNLDIVGEPAILAEAEIITTALRALYTMGLTPQDVRVHVNNRALMADIFLKLGIPAEHHAATFLALDKRGKIDDDAIRTILRDGGMDAVSIDNAFRVLGVHSIDEAETILGGPTPSSEALRSLLQLMDEYGMGGAVSFDIAVIRGLGYYTGIVFEGFDAGQSMRAIFGGGRYDNLLQSIGGKPATAVGMGFGDVVIGDLLTDRGLHTGTNHLCDFAVAFMTDDQRTAAVRVAGALRRHGHTVDLTLHSEKPKGFFARASRSSRAAIYLGPDDVTRGLLRIKNLEQRTEREYALADIIAGTAAVGEMLIPAPPCPPQ